MERAVPGLGAAAGIAVGPAFPIRAITAAHREAGCRAVLIRQDRVVLSSGGGESFLPGLGRLTVWRATHVGVTLESLLAAVAAVWALGIPLNLIGAGAEAFESDLQAALASLQLSQTLPPSDAPMRQGA